MSGNICVAQVRARANKTSVDGERGVVREGCMNHADFLLFFFLLFLGFQSLAQPLSWAALRSWPVCRV